MTECDRVYARAPGLAGLDAGDPERVAAWSHAKGCARCARALREAEAVQALVTEWVLPPLPAVALESVSQAIVAELRREARLRAMGSVAAVSAAVLAFVGFARTRSPSPADWIAAVVLWALAVMLASTATRRPLLATAGAVLGTVAAAALSAGPGPLDAALGLECLATEMGAAAAVVGAVWLAIRGGTTVPAPSAMAAAAATGALAGGAALHVTCAAHTSAPHVLVFHLGGVLLAVAAATALRVRAATAAARAG